MIKEIAFVVTPVSDVPRARDFYEGTLGLRPSMVAEEAGWIEYEIGSGAFAIARADEKWKPSEFGSTVAFEVENLEEMVGRLKERGAPIYLEITETPVCHLAVALDPDGSRVMIHKRKAG